MELRLNIDDISPEDIVYLFRKFPEVKLQHTHSALAKVLPKNEQSRILVFAHMSGYSIPKCGEVCEFIEAAKNAISFKLFEQIGWSHYQPSWNLIDKFLGNEQKFDVGSLCMFFSKVQLTSETQFLFAQKGDPTTFDRVTLAYLPVFAQAFTLSKKHMGSLVLKLSKSQRCEITQTLVQALGSSVIYKLMMHNLRYSYPQFNPYEFSILSDKQKKNYAQSYVYYALKRGVAGIIPDAIIGHISARTPRIILGMVKDCKLNSVSLLFLCPLFQNISRKTNPEFWDQNKLAYALIPNPRQCRSDIRKVGPQLMRSGVQLAFNAEDIDFVFGSKHQYMELLTANTVNTHV
jgi:hypothetical protein